MYETIYYLLTGSLLLYTIYGVNIPLVSFTGLYLRMLVLVVWLPSYYISRGGVLFSEDAQINLLIYFLLFLQILISCFCAILVWKLRLSYYINFKNKKNSNKISISIIIILIIYTGAYFYNYSNTIPILYIFNLDFKSNSAYLRSELTHNFHSDNLFAYYRLITKELFFVVFFTILINSKNKIIHFIIVLFLMLILGAQLEKSYVVSIILAYYMYLYFDQKINLKKELYLYLVFIIISIISINLFFSDSIFSSIRYLFFRLSVQVGYVSEQLSLMEQKIPLLINGISLGMMGRLFDVEQIEYSKLAWESIHFEQVNDGLSGSSAGLGIADAYIIFGSFGIIVFSFIIFVTFYIDRLFKYSYLRSNQQMTNLNVFKSFYLYFIIFYPMALICSFLGIFSIPYILNPGLIIVILFVCTQYKFKIIKNVIKVNNQVVGYSLR
jgi:hypothetical protein